MKTEITKQKEKFQSVHTELGTHTLRNITLGSHCIVPAFAWDVYAIYKRTTFHLPQITLKLYLLSAEISSSINSPSTSVMGTSATNMNYVYTVKHIFQGP